jgi:hypothetical protein
MILYAMRAMTDRMRHAAQRHRAESHATEDEQEEIDIHHSKGVVTKEARSAAPIRTIAWKHGDGKKMAWVHNHLPGLDQMGPRPGFGRDMTRFPPRPHPRT